MDADVVRDDVLSLAAAHEPSLPDDVLSVDGAAIARQLLKQLRCGPSSLVVSRKDPNPIEVAKWGPRLVPGDRASGYIPLRLLLHLLHESERSRKFVDNYGVTQIGAAAKFWPKCRRYNGETERAHKRVPKRMIKKSASLLYGQSDTRGAPKRGGICEMRPTSLRVQKSLCRACLAAVKREEF